MNAGVKQAYLTLLDRMEDAVKSRDDDYLAEITRQLVVLNGLRDLDAPAQVLLRTVAISSGRSMTRQ